MITTFVASVLLVAQAPMASHTFSLDAPSAKAAFVAGTFNGWNATVNPMTKQRDGRTWRATIKLPFGKVRYKFVIDGKWTTDPKAKQSEVDPEGNVNSVLVVLPTDYTKPAKIGDGIISKAALRHEQAAPMLNYDRGRLVLQTLARPGDVQLVAVLIAGKRTPMVQVASDEIFATYRAAVPWNRKTPIRYSFEYRDGRTTMQTAPYQLDPKAFHPVVVPNWVERGVIYQIFPDRFASSNPLDWGQEPSWFTKSGGNIEGIESRLSYLTDLGVKTIYFNPVFKSPSIHRYDAEDYKQVDPGFGTNEQFADLVKHLHEAGIRTVMDFALNHSATTFPPFKDLLEKQEKSEYKNWYFVKKYPVKVEMPPNYEAWWGFASMPKLNALNPATKEYLLSIPRFWQDLAKIDGIRLDVPNEVAQEFWPPFRKVVKEANPDAWICGEIWGDATPWLKGDQFDSVMNYPFRDAMVKFIAEGTDQPSQFAAKLMQNYTAYVPQVSRNMMNMLGTHDTPRFLTLAKGDRSLMKLAMLLQFGWVGVPSIYYGDELGMDGGKDPQNRRPMRWDLATDDNDMLGWTKALIKVRTSSTALQSGEPSILETDDPKGVLAFARTTDSQCAVVVANRSDSTKTVLFPLPKGAAFAEAQSLGFVDALSGKRFAAQGGKVSISLDGHQGVILLPATQAALRIAEGASVLASRGLAPK